MIEPTKILTRDLGDQIILSREEYGRMLYEVNELKATVTYLKDQLDKLRKLFNGSRSERFFPADQAQLSLDLDEAEPAVNQEKVESITTKTSSGKSHGRPPLPAHLQREDILLDPSVDLSGAKVIGVVETEILELVEAKIIVK